MQSTMSLNINDGVFSIYFISKYKHT